MAQEAATEPKARLELAVRSSEPSKYTLLLRLRNASSVAIDVDRDLVFLVDVVAMGSTGRAISWEIVGGAPAPDKQAGLQRVVSLKPGETVEREIDLSRGFRQFRAAKLFMRGDKDDRHAMREVIQAHEVIARLPHGVRPARVAVAYGQTHYITVSGIGTYVGVPYGSLNLYDGHLWAEVAIAPPEDAKGEAPAGPGRASGTPEESGR